MHNKFVTPAYLISIITQALFGLATPIGVMLLISWALVNYLSVGSFIYAILVPLGAIFGLYTMVCFIVRASSALEVVEKQRKEREKKMLMESAMKKEQAKDNEEPTKASDTENE